MGLKARDEEGCYGCSACHAVYDRQATRPAGISLEFVNAEFARAKGESRVILKRKGLLEKPRSVRRRPKSKKIEVTGYSQLQRQLLGLK
jgi:hypothetical protein